MEKIVFVWYQLFFFFLALDLSLLLIHKYIENIIVLIIYANIIVKSTRTEIYLPMTFRVSRCVSKHFQDAFNWIFFSEAFKSLNI